MYCKKKKNKNKKEKKKGKKEENKSVGCVLKSFTGCCSFCAKTTYWTVGSPQEYHCKYRFIISDTDGVRLCIKTNIMFKFNSGRSFSKTFDIKILVDLIERILNCACVPRLLLKLLSDLYTLNIGLLAVSSLLLEEGKSCASVS